MKKILQKIFDGVALEILLIAFICCLVFPSFNEENLWLKKILLVMFYFGFSSGILIYIFAKMRSQMRGPDLSILIFVLSILLLVVFPLSYFHSLDIFFHIISFLAISLALLGSILFGIRRYHRNLSPPSPHKKEYF